MENASKALIIAGAILLSIAIIGIGMSIFNQASDTINNSNMNETEMAQFNSKFESYEGSKKGSNVKQLITAIITNNANETGTTERIVKVTTSGTSLGSANDQANSTELTAIRTKLKASTTYTVGIEYTNGLVTKITIAE